MSNIDVPTMLVHGRESDVVDQASIDDFLSRVPDAKVVSVAGAAHMIAGDKNDAFSQAVLSFLEEDIRPTLSS